ncbi:hypothetical protein ES705_24426 [subsurface metagenome]
MKIGILTFHWATNYGAILQTYALQSFLNNFGHDVYIINYRPKQHKKTFVGCFLSFRFWLYLTNIKEYIKEIKLEAFRKAHLNETMVYKSLEELKSNPPEFDVYICGSDQIWNPFFTTRGEGKPTSVYFLDFGNNKVEKIAYAVSFGCESYPDAALAIAQKYIHNFKAISVRENSGLAIVNKIGIRNVIKLPDPTLLITRYNYNFEDSKITSIKKKVFVYILRNEYKGTGKIISYLKNEYELELSNSFLKIYSVEEWVQCIKNASLVLTNSYHGMIFSIIFHIPFIVIPAKKVSSGMNDRFNTILSYLNMEHRIFNNNIENLRILVEEQTNWDIIDEKLKIQRNESNKFFVQNLI